MSVELPKKKYQIIYADPPWPERGAGKIVRGAQKHYQLMKVESICELPIYLIADQNCHLYMWVTNNFLPGGLKVVDAWGFRYITMVTWVKDRIGLGQYFRGQTEHCLFAVKGMLPYLVKEGKRAQHPTFFSAPKSKHSAKPEKMRRIIDHVSGCAERRKIELFARGLAEGWDVWGNEVRR